MNRRILDIRRALSQKRIRAYLITHLPNVRYLTGFRGSNGWLLLTQEQSWFITDGRYETQAQEEVAGAEVRIARKTMQFEAGRLLKGLRLRSLVVEANHVTLELAAILRRGTGLSIRGTRDLVESLRITKGRDEVAALRKAIRNAENAFLEIKPLLRPGIRERDVAAALEAALKRRGSATIPFDAIVASGPRGALPHASPGNRLLEHGDLVVVDWGGEHDGYFSDMTRTFALGRIAGEAKHIYDIVHRAQRAAIQAVGPGVSFREVDEAARGVIRAADMGGYFPHGTGHGVGLEIHEAPTVSFRAKGYLKEGMVITVEPGIYVPGVGGVRIEDMVLVTATGSQRLTALPRRLELLNEGGAPR